MEKTCKNCGTPIAKEYCEDNYPEVCEHWTPKKPKTKADRIRAMSDEELAHELAFVAGWDRHEYEKAKRIGIEKVMLDWLKQPTEE